MQPTDCHSSRVMTDLYFWLPSELQRSSKVGAPGLVNFTTAVTRHF